MITLLIPRLMDMSEKNNMMWPLKNQMVFNVNAYLLMYLHGKKIMTSIFCRKVDYVSYICPTPTPTLP